MLTRLPLFIDPLTLCGRGQQLQGLISLAGMERLADSLSHQNGAVEVDLKFDVDAQDLKYMSGHLKSELALPCQRCFETLLEPIEIDVVLGFVNSESVGRELPAEYEPFVLTTPTVSLSELIEDELILALPIVALHSLQTCSAAAQQEETESSSCADGGKKKKNPFAVLAELKPAELQRAELKKKRPDDIH